MTWAHGAIATIRGSGFGVKGADPRPLVWAPLQSSLGINRALSRYANWVEPPKAQLAMARGMQIARWNARRDIGWPPLDDANAFQIRLPSPPDILYLRGKHYLDFDPVAAGGMNHKLWRAVPDNLEGGRINWYANWHHSADGDGRVGIEGTGAQIWNDRLYPIQRWNTEEWLYRRSSPDVADGRLAFRMNNENWGDHNPTVTRTATDSGITTFGMYDDLTNVPAGPETPEWWIGYRDLYYDDTWARVVIGNAATYNACTRTEIQIPVAWSDTEISVIPNAGQFEDLSGLWVYVFNAANVIVHTQRISSYADALPSQPGPAGTIRTYGPTPVPVGATSAHIRVSREAWPNTGGEVCLAQIQFSMDGSTWGAPHIVGARGGDHTLLRNGETLQYTSAAFQVPQPANPNRLARARVQYLSDLSCALQLRFE